MTAYVRHRLEQWEESGRKLKELVALGDFGNGIKSSMPSQVKNGSSAVTNFTGPKFAKAFGFADYPALVQAAYSWASGAVGVDVPPKTGGALAEGIRLAVGYGVTERQIDRVVAANADRREHLSANDWFAAFLAEQKLDGAVDRELKAEGRAATSREKVKGRYHAEVGDKRDERAKAVGRSADAAKAKPEPATPRVRRASKG